MINANDLTESNFTDVRYSRGYAILCIFLAIFLLQGAIWEYNAPETWRFINFFLLRSIIGLILLYIGIIALAGRKLYRLDKQNKILISNAIDLFRRKKHFDRIFLENDTIYTETNGKKKRLNVTEFMCNKSDLEAFKNEIKD